MCGAVGADVTVAAAGTADGDGWLGATGCSCGDGCGDGCVGGAGWTWAGEIWSGLCTWAGDGWSGACTWAGEGWSGACAGTGAGAAAGAAICTCACAAAGTDAVVGEVVALVGAATCAAAGTCANAGMMEAPARIAPVNNFGKYISVQLSFYASLKP